MGAGNKDENWTIVNDRITSRQFRALSISTIIEAGILRAPRFAAETAGPDVWIATMLALAGFIAILVLFNRLAAHFPQETIIDYSPRVVGRFLGFLVSIVFVLFFLFVVAKVARFSSSLIRFYLLPITPIGATITVLLLAAAYTARGGLETLARTSQILLPLTLIPVPVITMLALRTADFGNLLPVLNKGFVPVLKAAFAILMEGEGIEALLVLYPFVVPRQKVLSASVQSISLPVSVLAIFMVMTVTVLGIPETTAQTWPGAALIETVEVPGAFLERLTTVFIAFWIPIASLTVSINLYLASLSLAKLMKFREPRILVLPLLIVTYFLALLPPSFGQAERLGKITGWGLIGIAGISALVYVTAWLRKLR